MVYGRAVLASLHRRPRGRELAALLAVLSRGRVPSPLAPHALRLRAQDHAHHLEELARREAANAAVHEHLQMREALARTAISWSLDRHDTPEWPVELGAASSALLARLGEDGQAAVLAALPPADRELIEASPPVAGSRRLIGYGAARGVPLALARTGLLAVEPPDDIHAMCRGPDCVAGSIQTADLVLEALGRAGSTLAAGARALDFGCSSGRVVRVLAAVRPDVVWLGCDPNQAAIDWAAANLHVAEFFSNKQEPPLWLESGTLDLVYGISVWSHFAAAASLDWLAEMHRVLRPGGVLVMTAAGLANVAALTREWDVPAEYARAAWAALNATGFWWADAFGENGDWGVTHPQWGSAYFTPEWLLARILPDWSLRLYEPGRLLGVQDLYVLERGGGPASAATREE
jgi:SAM-dependent methyltransferase